jgi:tRNA-specific 2-thiouridylase
VSRERVVVAMSGGVDSSVAAALLVEAGHDVTGVMVHLWAEEENRCCSSEAVEDARRVANRLGIAFHVVDYEHEFHECVVRYFVAEYARGRTPNPCLACNQTIRFQRLLRHARDLGAGAMATGHYARIDEQGGRYRLRMGVDRRKDQSYVLYMLGQDHLRHLRFPLGEHTKGQVREMARERGLPVADKDESMEICFVTDNDYRRFLVEHAPETARPGPILDSAGQEIGRHRGLAFYTIGQRRGLGNLAARGVGGEGPEPYYVLRLDVDQNAVIAGPAAELGRQSLEAERVSYVSGEAPPAPVQVQAKIRYRAALAEATWMPIGQARAWVAFRRPLRDITPGQAVVAYQGDVVLGGGIIGEG